MPRTSGSRRTAHLVFMYVDKGGDGYIKVGDSSHARLLMGRGGEGGDKRALFAYARPHSIYNLPTCANVK